MKQQMSSLRESSQKLVAKLLLGGPMRERIEERKIAIKELATVPDKESVATYLVKRLQFYDRSRDEKDIWRRAWIVSALGKINKPETVKTVAARLSSKVKEANWVRFWAAVALAKMKGSIERSDLKDLLVNTATTDGDPNVEAVSLRLLIENGFEEYIEHLLKMTESMDWHEKAAACKALRHNVGPHPFPNYIEERFVRVLISLLHNKQEAMDVRRQAALALGNVKHKCEEAIEALSEALKKNLMDRDRSIRLNCVKALNLIAKSQTKNILMFALQDIDAEIRVDAANALRDTLKTDGAVKFIVEELMRLDTPQREYFQNLLDALRRIDEKEAAHVLAENLLHPDPDIQDRAQNALTQLGGEAAARTLQAQRTRALDTYTKLLDDADTRIMGQFNSIMARALRAFSVSMAMHAIIFIIGVVVVSASLYVALSQGFETFERYIGIGTAVGGLSSLLILFYKDPLENIRRSVTGLVKVNVLFLGYVRQINQIDATFKQMFLAPGGFGVEQMKETVNQIRDSVNKTLEEVRAYLGPKAPTKQ